MKLKSLLSLALVSLLFFTSCTKDESISLQPDAKGSNQRTANGGNNALGMWLWYLEGTGYSTHDALADKLATVGVNRIYVKVGDGTSQWDEASNTALVNAYRQKGIEVWAWAYNYPGNVQTQADILYQAAQTGYEGFVTDIEVEFDGKTTELHSIFGAFRTAINDAISAGHTTSDFKLYCTSWGNPVDHGMRVDIIDQYVDAHMPQTYLEVWGSSYMADPTYWVNYGTNEYRNEGCVKPIHHIVSAEYDVITSSQINTFIAAAGAETSVWRIPGEGTPLSIWNTLELVNWQADLGYESSNPTPPSDITDIIGHWAETEINYMVANGYMSGYGDGTFKPNNTLTRAEFAAMLVSTLSPEVKPEYASRNFSDISGHWAEDKILQAARAGYLAGNSDGTFNPNTNITRTEVLAVLASHPSGITGCLGMLNSYTDKDNIASWAEQAIANATARGLVANYPTKTTLYPNENAYRCEAVVGLYQLMAADGVAPTYQNQYIVVPASDACDGGGSTVPYIEGVPYFYQLNNSINPYGSCQNTAIAMILKYYGANVVPDDISNYYGTSQAQTVPGFETVFNSEAAYFNLNIRDKGTTQGSVQQLQQLLADGKPTAAHGYTTDYGHLIVFIGFDGEYYYAHDPYGSWNEVPYSVGGYYNNSTIGNTIKYHKSAIEDAFAPDGYIWLHEIVEVTQ